MEHWLGIELGQTQPLKREGGKEPDYMGENKEFLVLYTKEYLKSHPNINFFIYGHRHIELDLMLSATARILILGDWDQLLLLCCVRWWEPVSWELYRRRNPTLIFPDSNRYVRSDKPFVSKTIKATVADNDMIHQGDVHRLRRFLYGARQAFVFLAGLRMADGWLWIRAICVARPISASRKMVRTSA